MSMKKHSGWVAATLLLLFVLYFCVGGERYCHLYPSIDTRYAPGFTESGFAQVAVGMTKHEVLALLGPPFDPSTTARSRWSYTQDGGCAWADFAWLGREVVFKDDRVIEKIALVWYD